MVREDVVATSPQQVEFAGLKQNDLPLDRLTLADLGRSSGHYDQMCKAPPGSESQCRKAGSEVAVMECCCNETWVEFTADTSLHGLKYIWMRDIFVLRRLLWLVLTLCCSAIMMYQILDRIIYFDSMPVTVDVRINFNTSLRFPAVTICNQNAFRASRAAQLGIYDLVTDLYDNARPFAATELLHYKAASNLSLGKIYTDTHHQIEDLLISCQWRGLKCGPDNFQLVSTDHGMCFTLDNSNLIVNSAGADDGLSLTLNVEQYEYMPGPHDAAGLKILLHDRNEFPRVHALGQALSAGVHSFLAIKLVSVRNLPSPHGECDSPPLIHYGHYGTANCESECTARLLTQLCGCKLFYMPGNAPVCTLWQYYGCYVPQRNTLRQRTFDECYCPVPCSFLVFDPVVSYADASPLVVERFLADANKTALAAKFHQAREITHRLQREKREVFEDRLEDLEMKFNTLQNISMKDISMKLASQREGLAKMEADVYNVFNRTSYLFRYQQYIVEKDFVRAADAMSERTFHSVANAMQEFVHKVESQLQQLVDPDISDPAVRQVIYLVTLNDIDGKIDITHRALENYTELYNAIMNGTPIFNYKFYSEPRKNSVDIVPLPLFHHALNRTKTIRVRSEQVGVDLENILSNLTLYRNLTVEAFNTKALNLTSMWRANVYYLKSCREYLQSIDMFLNDGLGYTVSFMDDRFNRFSSNWRDFDEERDSLNLQIDRLSSLARGLEEGIFRQVERGLNSSRAFLQDGSVSKEEIARLFASTHMQLGQSDLKKFFAELRARGQEVYDLWERLEKDSEELYNVSLNDPNLQNYYQFKGVWSYLGSLAEALKLIHGEYDQYKAADIREAIKNYDDEFLKSLEAMAADMQLYLDSGQIDTTFIRDNFLRLNIFYRELNYEQITQQEAYDIFALLCDIGGSMGLFLGASVLTIFELLDLFVFQYRKKR